MNLVDPQNPVLADLKRSMSIEEVGLLSFAR